jgi:hypothetical protein
MARKKRKPPLTEKASARPARPRKRRKPTASAPPSLPFDQELLQLARSAAGTLQRAFVAVLVLAALGGSAAGLWALRPIPTFSSADVAAGSPFDVTFQINNRNSWLDLANLKISCVLAQVRASPISPTMVDPTMVDATNVQFAGKQANGLEPGESGTFTCPFQVALTPTKDDPGIAQRAEIYFRSEYDLPLIGSLRLTDNSARFSLNTRLLPPRWTSKPNR